MPVLTSVANILVWWKKYKNNCEFI